MMNGVEVLNSVDVMESSYEWLFPILFVLGMVIMGLGIAMLAENHYYSGIILTFVGVGLALGSVIGGKVAISQEYNYTKYEVIISDNVNMNEFNQKYEILEQRGRIYVIRERESGDDN